MTSAEKTERFIEEEIEKNIYDQNEIILLVGNEDQKEINNAADLLAMNIQNSFGAAILEKTAEPSYDEIINKVTSAIKTKASSQYKGTNFIEPIEIEEIKKMLITEDCANNQKSELEKELTRFQEEITNNYYHTLTELKETIIDSKTQIERLEEVKKQVVMKKLSKMSWPYDENTKKYDAKIANLKIQLARAEQKLEEIEAFTPAANEKDILLFQVQLKDKFKV